MSKLDYISNIQVKQMAPTLKLLNLTELLEDKKSKALITPTADIDLKSIVKDLNNNLPYETISIRNKQPISVIKEIDDKKFDNAIMVSNSKIYTIPQIYKIINGSTEMMTSSLLDNNNLYKCIDKEKNKYAYGKSGVKTAYGTGLELLTNSVFKYGPANIFALFKNKKYILPSYIKKEFNINLGSLNKKLISPNDFYKIKKVRYHNITIRYFKVSNSVTYFNADDIKKLCSEKVLYKKKKDVKALSKYSLNHRTYIYVVYGILKIPNKTDDTFMSFHKSNLKFLLTAIDYATNPTVDKLKDIRLHIIKYVKTKYFTAKVVKSILLESNLTNNWANVTKIRNSAKWSNWQYSYDDLIKFMDEKIKRLEDKELIA